MVQQRHDTVISIQSGQKRNIKKIDKTGTVFRGLDRMQGSWWNHKNLIRIHMIQFLIDRHIIIIFNGHNNFQRIMPVHVIAFGNIVIPYSQGRVITILDGFQKIGHFPFPIIIKIDFIHFTFINIFRNGMHS